VRRDTCLAEVLNLSGRTAVDFGRDHFSKDQSIVAE
jgi:hypothetical protein